MDNMDFAGRLKHFRELRGWSLTELGRRSTVSHSMILLLERGGRNPSLDTVRKLAGALGVSIGMIVGEEMKAVSSA